ncbi:uncharacterized protein LOC100184884 [Ciona intestinalis]
MECVHKPGDTFGCIRFDHLGHTSNTCKGYIRPSVWLKYGGIALDWLMESILLQQCYFRTCKMKIEFTSAIQTLHNGLRKVPGSKTAVDSMIEGPDQSYDFSFDVCGMCDKYLVWKCIITNVSYGDKVAVLNGMSEFCDPTQITKATEILGKSSIDMHAYSPIQHDLKTISFNDKIWETTFPLTHLDLNSNMIITENLVDNCINAMHEANCAGVLKSSGIQSHIADYIVKTSACEFFSNVTATPGDEIEIVIWQNINHKRMFYFVITKCTDMVATFTLQLFDNISRENPKL